jgi:hypothetical protein
VGLDILAADLIQFVVDVLGQLGEQLDTGRVVMRVMVTSVMVTHG